VLIQAVFVILTFSKHHVETLLTFLENKLPFLRKSLSENLEKQKNLLWHKNNPSSNHVESVNKIIILKIYFVEQTDNCKCLGNFYNLYDCLFLDFNY
jgi:hypothetical protein